MLMWNEETANALLSMGKLFPHLMFVGRHEHTLSSILKEFMKRIGRSFSDGDVMVQECEANGGIATVRDVLRPFTRGPRHPRPALVVLYRFDRLSPDAQFALRRTMEIDQDKCRCLAMSTSTSSIIQPLHSRFVSIGCEPQNAVMRLFATNHLNGSGMQEGWGVEELKGLGPRQAMVWVRQRGISVIAVLGWLEREAEAGRVGWRAVVAAMVAAIKVQDEAAGLLMIGNELRRMAEQSAVKS